MSFERLREWFGKPHLLFKAKAPNLDSYIGRDVLIDGKKVLIYKIVGNKTRPTFYEINGQFLIGMLRFHAYMTGDKSITEQQFLDFENMEVRSEKIANKPKEKLDG